MASATTTIDNQINNYLSQLNLRQQDDVYSDEFKAELDSRYEEYKNGGKLISEAAVNRRIDKIIKGGKKK